jgi:predicted ArsR family transcriptional regulator
MNNEGEGSMNLPQWNSRFLASTRGQIIELLRRGSCTVNDLASALGLTDNAVRAHLATLERDDLVREGTQRPGLRKPHTTYELTPAAEQLFPKSYDTILNHLLDVLDAELPEAALEAMLREVGHRVAASQPARSGTLDQRLERVVTLFQELGGLATVERHDGQVGIRGQRCPLATVSARHPEICRLAETLVAEILEAPVHERCTQGAGAQCYLEVETPR